mmetsp:Transcript_13300/g.32512  ORF Transcript_13300/g.32512 Transcript_13300/m.32512 type:complete len:207 (+) Transcript_13300:121-741(+)
MSTDYERLQEANIERNRQIMMDLGIDSDEFKKHAAQAKAPRAPRPPGAKKRGLGLGPPERRSARVRKEAPEGCKPAKEGGGMEGEGCGLAPAVSREAHEAAKAAKHALRYARRQKKETIVGRASYSHTVRLVRNMEYPVLATLIRTIERKKGQFAVVKMRLLVQVLCLEGLDELAADASAAAVRLGAVLGEPVLRASEEGEGDDGE